MRASGAAILGAAVVAGAFLAVSSAKADEPGNETDFDVDSERQLAVNYYAMAITDPLEWNAGQLLSLEGLLNDFGMEKEADNINALRTELYGAGPFTPLPLPDIFFIPPTELDAIADAQEAELGQ